MMMTVLAHHKQLDCDDIRGDDNDDDDPDDDADADADRIGGSLGDGQLQSRQLGKQALLTRPIHLVVIVMIFMLNSLHLN